jgi:hypothetical protein
VQTIWRVMILAMAVLLAQTAGAEAMVSFDIQENTLTVKHDGGTLPVSLRSPQFTFSLGEAPFGGALPTEISGDLNQGEPLRVSYAPAPLPGDATLEVVLHVEWFEEEGVLRKRAEYRLTGLHSSVQVMDVLFDSFPVDLLSEPFPGSVPRSMPAFLKGYFAGIEFPIAATRVEDDRLLLGHKPLMNVEPGAWNQTRTAVYGVADGMNARAAFHRYIEFHRPEPKALHFNYNSWWTSPVPFSESDILGLMKTFEDNLFKAHGVGFDTFTIDLGWSDPKTIWGISADLFPEGFSRIQEGAERMGGHLGLWVSPSSFYGPGLDTEWAREAGYETFTIPWGENEFRLLSLGGERYAAAFRDQLSSHVGTYDIRQVKLDGYFLGYDYMAGPFSSEQTAEGGIAAFRAMREANPHVWLECTFDANASPWWLFHLNSVIGLFGDDSPYGRVPCPVYRESYTTARDYFNLRGADRLMSPVAAQEILGIIHQSNEPFMNDAVTTILRGHAFLPMYINPKFMTDARWKKLADTLKWARANEDLLVNRQTLPLRQPSWQGDALPRFSHDAFMPREPYGYAHWDGDCGIVLLRNPWAAPQTYALHIGDEAGPAGVSVSVVSLYPEARTYGASIETGNMLDVSLAPYETVVLSIGPDQPVDSLPAWDACIEGHVSVADVEASVRGVRYTALEERFGPDWTSLAGDPDSALEATVRGTIKIDAPKARLLFVLESADAVPAARATLRVNGFETPLESTTSAAGFAASSVPASEHWAILMADLTPGSHDIELHASVDGGAAVVSAWVWATREGGKPATYPNGLPEPETLSLGGAALLEPVLTEGIDHTEAGEAPVERIDGVYLDALEPVSATQGWGDLQRNQSVWEKPLTVGGKHFARGLGTHAESRIVYALDGTHSRFTAVVGPDGANNGTVSFEVHVDGEMRWESGRVSREDGPRQVDVDITGATELVLVVGDGGDGITGDHANWADAKLLR